MSKMTTEQVKKIMSICSEIKKNKKRLDIPNIVENKCDGYAKGSGDEPSNICLDCPMNVWYEE